MGMVYELDDIEKRAVLPPTELGRNRETEASAREFVEVIARMTRDGECAACHGEVFESGPGSEDLTCDDHEAWEANAIDSFETLQAIITKARQLTTSHSPATPRIQQ